MGESNFVKCPYKEKDTEHIHVFHYGSEDWLCDKLKCVYNSGIGFLVEGEGNLVDVCVSNCMVRKEESRLKKMVSGV